MRKILIGILMVSLLASVSGAQLLIGSRAAGMGGAGVAASRDQSAAYYNPAAFMRAGKAGFMTSLGAAYSGLDKIMNAASSASDPAKFVTDNYASKIELGTSIYGLIGGNINKVGLTVLPALNLTMNKQPVSLVAMGSAGLGYQGIATLGYTFGLPVVVLDVGANVKYIGGNSGEITFNGLTGNQDIKSMSGFGFDVGSLLTFDIPAVTSLSVGLVARDLGETITTSTKRSALTPGAGNTITVGPEQDLGSTSLTADPSYVLGVSGNIPVVGIVAALDYESGKNFNNTHIGLEYPLLANFLALRAGVVSGTATSLTTFGAKVGIPFFTLNAALVMDGKNTNNNLIVLDLLGGV